MKRIAIAVILALLALLLVPTAVAVSAAGVQVVDRTGDGVWTDDTWQVQIYPGETKATTIRLYNSSSSSLDVSVRPIPDSTNLAYELDKASFAMPGRSYTDVTLSVTASGSATPGTYTAELEIKSEAPPSVGGGGGGISKLRIYDLTVENITEDSADIFWKTNRSATSQVTYWSSLELEIEDETRVKEHSLCLRDLEQDTIYSFEVYSRDKYKKSATEEGEFTTLKEEVVPAPPPTPPPVPEPAPPEPTPPVPPPTPPPAPVEPTPWGLIGSVIGAAAIAGGIGYWLWRRKKEAKNGQN